MGSKRKINFGEPGNVTSARTGETDTRRGRRLDPNSHANFISGWQHERETLLQKICERIEAAIGRGKPVRKTIRHMVKLYNDRAYKSDAKRRIQLTEVTLIRLRRVWQRNGCVPSAFRFRYRPLTSKVPAQILIRFVNFCAGVRSPHFKTAWQMFVDMRGNFGRVGRRRKSPLTITCGLAAYYFPPARFRALQACLKEIESQQTELNRLRLGFIIGLQHRLPTPAKRKWQRRPVNFEI